VLAGIVTMTNNSGTVQAGENEAVVAGAKGAPEKITVQANSDFAFDLYKQLAKENDGKNLFFSPYSVSGALAMTAEGARGKTAEEMGKVLRFPDATRRTGDDAQRIPWETSQIHTGFGEINARLNEKLSDADRKKIEGQIATLQTELKAMQEKASKMRDQKLNAEIAKLVTQIKTLDGKINPPKLAVANALWGEKTFPFRKDYVDTISASYKTGGLFPIDFAKNPEPSRLHINGWVEEQTNNRIKDLIPKDDIDGNTKLVLTNAIYFKGNWTNPFDKKMTRTRDFTRSDGSKVQTPIMFGSLPVKLGGQKVAEDTHVSVAELPYVGDELSMVLITAGRGKPLNTIEKHLTASNLDKWLGTLKKGHQDIHVSLPRFKMESKYKLNDTLKAMGMPTAFQAGGADFSGLNESYGKELSISSVRHKGFIDVNEEGTEAAAATAVVIGGRSMSPSFDGTRPFIYLIRDNATGTILFMGRMMDPTEK
jgi:serine protease inhibitor